jgi:hypothetical protein
MISNGLKLDERIVDYLIKYFGVVKLESICKKFNIDEQTLFNWANFIFDEESGLLDFTLEKKKILDAQIEKHELLSQAKKIASGNKKHGAIDIIDESRYRWLIKLSLRNEINFIVVFNLPMKHNELIHVKSLKCDCDIHQISDYEYKQLCGVNKFFLDVNQYTLHEFRQLVFQQSSKVK